MTHTHTLSFSKTLGDPVHQLTWVKAFTEKAAKSGYTWKYCILMWSKTSKFIGIYVTYAYIFVDKLIKFVGLFRL